MNSTEPQLENRAPSKVAAGGSVCGKVGAFLTRTETPRWHTYAAAVIALVASVAINNFSDGKKRNDDYRVQQVRSLSDSMTQFQVHASAFALQLSETKKVDIDTKQTLIENLNEQYARLEIVRTLIPATDAAAIATYRDAILNMERVANSADDLMSMGPFWSAASKLLVARNHLNEVLRRSI